MGRRIALISLASWGDCINSTLMFKPLKEANPGCVLDVHVCAPYASAFANNPYVDGLTQYPAESKSQCFDLYNVIPDRVRMMNYDLVLVPAPILYRDRSSRRHPEFGQNLICTFMRALEDANIDYGWPAETVLQLRQHETDNVAAWLAGGRIDAATARCALMEVHGESGQTFWDKRWTLAAARHLLRRHDYVFISNKSKTTEIALLESESRRRIRWCGDLSIRECAELYNYCATFFSVSSGLSNACCTPHCRRPDGRDRHWVEVTRDATTTSAPLGTAGKIFWHTDDLPRFIGMLADRGI